MPDDKQQPRRLNVAQPDAQDVRTLPPLSDSFPASEKVVVGDLDVPTRRITLTDGEQLDVYDTTGPQDPIPAPASLAAVSPGLTDGSPRAPITSRSSTTRAAD